MSKAFRRFVGMFRNRMPVGVDNEGNRYFSRFEEIDGAIKERRWVKFKGEDDPTSIPVEWICWLNGQRRNFPTPKEINELEARREQLKLNVSIIEKEAEEAKSKDVNTQKNFKKVGGPDMRSFIQQFQRASINDETHQEKASHDEDTRSGEASGSGESFRVGTWQPPTT